ncbi:hypothetical protein FV222_28450, partial [Methylobacterium sp. WL103]
MSDEPHPGRPPHPRLPPCRDDDEVVAALSPQAGRGDAREANRQERRCLNLVGKRGEGGAASSRRVRLERRLSAAAARCTSGRCRCAAGRRARPGRRRAARHGRRSRDRSRAGAGA